MTHGGWTVIQHRLNGTVLFNRTFVDYENGFGDLGGEFWLGLEKIHRLANTTNLYHIRFNVTTDKNVTKFIEYEQFGLGSHLTKYTLLAANPVSGDLPNGTFSYNSGSQFATLDQDNNFGCGHRRHSGWWFKNCVYINVNGIYGVKNTESGFIEHFKEYHNLIQSTVEIKHI